MSYGPICLKCRRYVVLTPKPGDHCTCQRPVVSLDGKTERKDLVGKELKKFLRKEADRGEPNW